MSHKLAKSARKRGPGRPRKSGVNSPLCRAEFPVEYPELWGMVLDRRDGIVADQIKKAGVESEDQLPATLRLKMDNLMDKYVLSLQAGAYIKRHGILKRDRLEQKVLEVEPVLNFWLSLMNSIDRDLASLGLEPIKEGEGALDLGRYIAENYPAQSAGQGGDSQDKSEAGGGSPHRPGGEAKKTQPEAAEAVPSAPPGDPSDDGGQGEGDD